MSWMLRDGQRSKSDKLSQAFVCEALENFREGIKTIPNLCSWCCFLVRMFTKGWCVQLANGVRDID